MRSSGIHHVDLVVSSIERSLPFYRELLGPLGFHRVGIHHLAFEAWSRRTVDERADWLRAHGAEIESGPEEYGYMPGYYAVFFYDPDGIKLEIVHVPALAELRR